MAKFLSTLRQSARPFSGAILLLVFLTLCSQRIEAQTTVSTLVAQNLGQVAVNGSTPATQTLAFTFSGSGIPVFSLNYGVDFAAGTPSCTGSAPLSCTLAVSFRPHYPGLRRDAVLVKNSGGTLLESAALYGVGLGPQAVLYPGVIKTLAGTGAWAYTGDGGAATAATLRNPQGVAVDAAGNVFIADSVNQVVREVSVSTGRISTVAGSGASGYTGDGGLALKASLNSPAAVAVDGAGNLYIADEGNNAIRVVNAATRQISTVAGGGFAASGSDGLGDGGAATAALLNGPSDVALDGAGNLYIADSFNGRIRRVDAVSGKISVVAGGGTTVGTDGLGDGALATGARLNAPASITVDASGDLFIADTGNSLVRRVDGSSGLITVVAGTGVPGYTGDNGRATAAKLGSPDCVRLDAAGNLYIADAAWNVVRQVESANGVIVTLAGTGARRYTGDGGIPTAATLANPAGIALDSAGSIYIADYTNNAIRQVSLAVNSMAFASTLVGEVSAPQTMTLANLGNQSLSLTGLSVSSNFSQVALGGVNCAATMSLASGAACAVSVDFAPAKAASSLTGTVTLTDNSLNTTGSMQTASLSGSSVSGGIPQISFSSTAVNFPAQSVGSVSAPTVVTVSNAGTAPLGLSSIQVMGVNGADFNVTTNCQSVIAANASCTVSLTFAPSASGTRTASVAFTDLLATSPQTIALSGVGGSAQAALSANTVAFGRHAIGGLSSSKTVAVTNSGSVPLNIASLALSGTNASDYSLAGNCSAIAAGAGCSLTVTFTPRALGLRSASLVITDNAAGSVQTVSLQGTGGVQSTPAVFRPSNGTWYVLPVNGTTPKATQWGIPGDVPVPGDYDGDGKIDMAVYRPSTATWYIIPSSGITLSPQQWGGTGDVPVPGDYDGDGKTDIAVFRPSTGAWYVLPSSHSAMIAQSWGGPGDLPFPGDYDGDGKTDIAVFRPSNGTWYILASSGIAFPAQQWGSAGDTPIPGDYDGDGKTDIAVFRPSNGTWYVLPSSKTPMSFQSWGISTDVPVPGDYDGDGKTDIAVFRPSNGTWYILGSSKGVPSVTLGASGDAAVPSL